MMTRILHKSAWSLAAGAALLVGVAPSGCQKEEVLDVETPSGELEVDQDKETGELDVEVEEEDGNP
jgi:hypothetical protein